MKNALKTFGPNLNGRDFVIGDLHGAMPAFRNLCAELHLDPMKDRMFSVGDLVDRGPESMECLRLVRENWFHPVLSNHEQMMLEAFSGGPMGQYWFHNGGRWGAEALTEWKAKQRGDSAVLISDESAELFDLLKTVDELPFLITINHKSGKKFHILHAELPPRMSGLVDDEVMADDEAVRELAMTQAGDGDAFLWARYLFQNYSRVKLDKDKIIKHAKAMKFGRLFNDARSPVISGHSIVSQPLTIVGQTNIDTCAYGTADTDPDGWNALTCIELDTWTFYQATPSSFKVVEPITVNKGDLDSTESE